MLFSPDETRDSPNETRECDICQKDLEGSPAQNAIRLRCGHEYCPECALYYVQLGGQSKRLTFNHIFCPYRCGSSFADAVPKANRPLTHLLVEQNNLMLQVRELAIEKLIEENTVFSRATISSTDIDSALRIYPFYQCDSCAAVFHKPDGCCVAGSEDAEDTYCAQCKAHGFTKNGKKYVSRYMSIASSEKDPTEEYEPLMCDSDDNALEQQNEYLVISSIYSTELRTITSPPNCMGEPCMSFAIHAPKIYMNVYSKDSVAYKILEKVASELSFQFRFPSGYPSDGDAEVTIETGNLSLLDFTSAMRVSLTKALEDTILVNRGRPSVFECMQALGGWFGSPEVQEIVKVLTSRIELQHESRDVSLLIRYCKEKNAKMCGGCKYGPILPDALCDDLAAYHGQRLNSGWWMNSAERRIDNSCPSCGWFRPSWRQWLTWDGVLHYNRRVKIGPSDQEDEKKKKMREKQELFCLAASLRAHARMCPSCKYGPVLHEYCSNLLTHHGEKKGGSAQVSNACPRCKWLGTNWGEWLPWDGKMGNIPEDTSATASSKSKYKQSNDKSTTGEETGRAEEGKIEVEHQISISTIVTGDLAVSESAVATSITVAVLPENNDSALGSDTNVLNYANH